VTASNPVIANGFDGDAGISLPFRALRQRRTSHGLVRPCDAATDDMNAGVPWIDHETAFKAGLALILDGMQRRTPSMRRTPATLSTHSGHADG
jgi:hypothetical protein